MAINGNNTAAIQLAEKLEAEYGVVQLEAFKDFPFILLKSELKLRSLVDAICGEHQFIPNGVYETENLDVCQSLVHDDYGIAFLPSTIRENAKKKESIFLKLIPHWLCDILY